VGGALGDPYRCGNVAQTDARVMSHACEDVGVVGQKVPPPGRRGRPLLIISRKRIHELRIHCVLSAISPLHPSRRDRWERTQRSIASRFASSRLPSSQTPRRSPVDLDRGRRSDPGAGVADHHVPEAPAARIASPRGGISAGRALPRRPANGRLPEGVGAPEPVDHRGGPDGTEDEGDDENDRQRNGLENSHCPSMEGGPKREI
jgi:hypothetical protein